MKICIYGCGELGAEAILHYHDIGLSIPFLCDSNFEKWGQRYRGIEIISPQMLADRMNEIDGVVIATKYVDEVMIALDQVKIDIEKIKMYRSGSGYLCSFGEVYRNRSWSQDGEDIYLQERFRGKQGFYVDVGALHPFRFSNTAWAYELGWNGINIEPNANNFQLFEIFRPRDININCGISDKEGELTYYCFEEPALNGFDPRAHSDISVYEKRSIEVRKLSDILNEHKIKKIDFLNIDVEGFEMNVLRSINFIVDIECIMLEQHVDADVLNLTQEYKFLKEKGYHAVAKYGRTTIYEKS